MAKRIDLQYMLEDFLGSKNVYFQPPENLKIKYPAIIYSLNDIRKTPADNIGYLSNHMYQLIYITKDPDDSKIDEFLDIPGCSFDRSYKSNNLNHYVYTLNY